jgi:carboxyl-terminal processing protease
MPEPALLRRPLPVYFLLLLGILAGVMLDRSGWLPGSMNRAPAHVGATFDPFWEAWNLIERNYVDRSALQPVRMTQGAIAGLVESLGDTGHSSYLTADELHQLTSGLNGEMEGVGARMSIRRGRPTIVQTLPDSPARTAGLQPGDIMLEVDQQSVANLPLSRIVDKVRGPAGTTVHLRVLREKHAQALDFSIVRAKVELAQVTWHRLPGPAIAHIAIQEFGAQADAELKTALLEARQQGGKGLIIDIRGNPGGLKDQAVAVTSEFLAEGLVLIEQDAHGQRKEVPVQPGGVATDLPVVILMDEGTASSAEIFAGALQDSNRATLVGTHTFGTGTVLEPFLLQDGSAVLLAVAEWYTPKGRQIWHQSITPDVEVPLPENATALIPEEEDHLSAAALAETEDKQLLKAWQIMKDKIH